MVILVSNYRWPPSPGKQTLKQASCPAVQSCFSCTDPSTPDGLEICLWRTRWSALSWHWGGAEGEGGRETCMGGGLCPSLHVCHPLPQPLLLQTHLPFPQAWLRWGRQGISSHIGQGGRWVHPGYPGWGNISWLFNKHKYKAESKVSGISVIF